LEQALGVSFAVSLLVEIFVAVTRTEMNSFPYLIPGYQFLCHDVFIYALHDFLYVFWRIAIFVILFKNVSELYMSTWLL